MRYEDLPASMRKQVDSQLGGAPKKTRRQSAEPCPGHCGACGESFASYGKAFERHSDSTGHRRWCVDL